MAKCIPLFQCQECGRTFATAADAERAYFVDDGCPDCGGSDFGAYDPDARLPHRERWVEEQRRAGAPARDSLHPEGL